MWGCSLLYITEQNTSGILLLIDHLPKYPIMMFNCKFLGGFESSTHRRIDGVRLDMIAATQHDRFAIQDYQRLRSIGIRCARDAVRWHLVEPCPGRYDLSSLRQQVDGARKAGVEVIWDLFHYGFPDDLDIFSDEFVDRFTDLALVIARFLDRHSYGRMMVVPVNEISFFSWIAGDVGQFAPYEYDRGDELKRQLVRAHLGAVEAVRSIRADAVIMITEPTIHVVGDADDANGEAAESYRLSQYQAIDMLLGRLAPELGGHERSVDVIGLNYYPHNQWLYPTREMIGLDDPRYRPLSEMLMEVGERYGRPIFIAETGTEDEPRVRWLRYVADEYQKAELAGVDLNGICLYPIVNHPGWLDERHCHNGLWDYADETGYRSVYRPLLDEIRRSDQERALRRAA